ncbi:MAG: hypothetical protein OEV94_01795 [Deltaproteobacteria bacterium]|nr:hypothetical protein [Deltaproteobacteria bacterium]
MGGIWSGLLVSLLAGCLSSAPRIVPHPQELQPDVPPAQLMRLYTVPAETNPLKLGDWNAFHSRSTFTLVMWPVEAMRLEQDRVAYSQSPAEHEAALTQRETLFKEGLVFDGELIGPERGDLFLSTYAARQGLYLMDDAGNKFYPIKVEDEYGRGEYIPGDRGHERKGEMPLPDQFTLRPRVVFPAQALTPATKALFLYVAAQGKVVRFQWRFGEDTERTWTGRPGEGRQGLRRIWGQP